MKNLFFRLEFGSTLHMNKEIMDAETFDFIRRGLILYLILISSLCVHEWAHAFTADKLGDRLPRSMGRVTLNPIAHMDPIGTGLIPLLMIFGPLFLGSGMPLALIGWGKPVPISLPNPKTRRRDDLLITAAGPLSNLLIASCIAFLGGFLKHLSPDLVSLCAHIIYLNIALFIFNLIPVPPLDGSHFLKHALGMSEEKFQNYARYGFIIMIVLINLEGFRHLMSSAIHFFGSLLFYLMLYIMP